MLDSHVRVSRLGRLSFPFLGKWLLLAAVLALNLVVFLSLSRLLPDERSRRFLLYQLLPGYLPAWLSSLLWMFATGGLLEAFSRTTVAQRGLRRLAVSRNSVRIRRRLLSYRPIRSLVGWVTKPETDVSPRDVAAHLPRAIRWGTLLVAVVYFSISISLLPKLRRAFFWIVGMIFNAIFWFILTFYFLPLCDYFGVGAVRWQLILITFLLFAFFIFLVMYTMRLRRLARKVSFSRELLIAMAVPLVFWIVWGCAPQLITNQTYVPYPEALHLLPDYFPRWYTPILWTVTFGAYLEVLFRWRGTQDKLRSLRTPSFLKALFTRFTNRAWGQKTVHFFSRFVPYLSPPLTPERLSLTIRIVTLLLVVLIFLTRTFLY